MGIHGCSLAQLARNPGKNLLSRSLDEDVTVAYSRALQQDEPVTMQELLGRFDEFKWVPEVFNNILQSVPAPKPVVVPVPEKQFDTTKVWTESTKLRLWYGPKKEPSWTFAVRDGSPQNTAAGPRKVVGIVSLQRVVLHQLTRILSC